MKITYLEAGEHRIPNLTIPPQPRLNKYALMRRKYLQEHRPALYTSLLLSGELSRHLQETGERTRQQVESIMTHLMRTIPAPRPGDTMAMTRYRTSLLNMAEEQVFPETLYV